MRRASTLVAALAAAAVLGSTGRAAVTAPAQPGDTGANFSVADVLNGKQISQAECRAIASAVWVSADGSSECLRYYMSPAPSGHEAVVLLNGDFVDNSPGKAPSAPEYDQLGAGDLLRYAERRGRLFGRTFLTLARPGTLGSSGNELAVRHTAHELRLVNAALDAIASERGVTTYHLIGQSGGSILIGGLLAMRSDIGCASIGSGRLSLAPYTGDPRDLPSEGRKAILDDQAYVGLIRPSRSLRVFVLSDPDDQYSAIEGQKLFVRRAAEAGVPVKQLMTVALPDEGAHHDVQAQAVQVMKACLDRSPDERIAAIVQEFAKENAQKWAQLSDESAAAMPVRAPVAEAPRPARAIETRPHEISGLSPSRLLSEGSVGRTEVTGFASLPVAGSLTPTRFSSVEKVGSTD
jgi:hypothetical protein